MADYIYLLQTRLTPAQRTALQHVRDAAKSRGMTVFLVGGAVRDLSTGAPIRDLDFAVQGNAAKLKKDLQKFGTLVGEEDAAQVLFFNFPGGIRVEVGATLSVTFPKPGRPVYKSANILDDLRRRDFTANAMAISLNDGSYGLLMDPLNGIADLENRELRLVSNYGFIEDPSRMVRAARFSARLGWTMEAKTQQRYDTGRSEGYISALNPFQRAYELEEIFHEEDPLRVLRKLEAEGWAKALSPVFSSSKANEPELEKLRDTIGQMEGMGIHPDPSAAYFPLLTAKLAPKDVAALKAGFARPGFADQIAALEPDTKAFTAEFTGKAAAAPSAAWKMLFSAPPEPVLWLAHTTKSAPLKARFHAFFNDWSQARTKIPYQLMQEMRITPELPGYDALLEDLFFAIMDGKLDTPEAAKAFLEPFSPPAPPPPINLRRRAVKREAKPAKSRAKKAVAAPREEDLDLEVAASPEAPAKPAAAAGAVKAPLAPAKAPAVKAPATPVKTAAVKTPSTAAKAAPVKTPAKVAAVKPAPAKVVTKTPAKPIPAKKTAAPAKKSAPIKAAKVVAKKSVPSKAPVKAVAKKAIKAVAVKTPAKKATKVVVKKAVKLVARKAAKPQPKKAAKPAAKPVKKTATKPKPKR